MDQKALDRLLQAQATFEAVGGMTQDRLVAQVRAALRCSGGLSMNAQVTAMVLYDHDADRVIRTDISGRTPRAFVHTTRQACAAPHHCACNRRSVASLPGCICALPRLSVLRFWAGWGLVQTISSGCAPRLAEAGRCASPWLNFSCRSPTCCCSTSPPTTSTPRQRFGLNCRRPSIRVVGCSGSCGTRQ